MSEGEFFPCNATNLSCIDHHPDVQRNGPNGQPRDLREFFRRLGPVGEGHANTGALF